MRRITLWSMIGLIAAVLLTAMAFQCTSTPAGRLHIIADRIASTPSAIAPASEPPTARTFAETIPTVTEENPAAPTDAIASEQDHEPPERANRLGPPDAPVRLELFWDYHALDNLTMDFALRPLIEKHPQAISLVLRHAPRCRVCNTGEVTLQQAGVCRAAQATEAAGVLKGSAGFWRMHRWLVLRAGRFTEPQLRAALGGLGFDDAEQFLETMQSRQVSLNLTSDDVEAKIRRVTGRPAVAFNGRLWGGGNAVVKVQQEVLAAVEQGVPPSRILTSKLEGFSDQLQRRAVTATIHIVNSRRSFEGSGVVVGRQANLTYALTANHVVVGADRVEVQTFTATSYPHPDEVIQRGEVIARAVDEDLAVIRFVAAGKLPSLPIAPQSQLPNERQLDVLTVGCSLGEAPTGVGDRIIGDELVRRPDAASSVRLWRLQNSSILGRSGGPLINRQGALIGIASGIGDDESYFSHLSLIHQLLTRSQLGWLLMRPAVEKLP